jgi:hypothetical protein
MNYFQNPTLKRLYYVRKTYGHQPETILFTLIFAFYTVGADAQARALENASPESISWSAVEMVMPRHHKYDFLFPWFAREVSRLAHVGFIGIDPVTRALAKGNAIGQWALDNRVDLTRTTLETALVESQKYAREARVVPQGFVFFTFDDGWTVQRLGTREELDAEGEMMQHCVGAYFERADILTGTTTIFSLRDPHGKPHVTMEYSRQTKRFVQIRGKQNDPPIAAYAARVQTFIREAFAAEPVSMILAGADPRTLNLVGADLQDTYLRDQNLSGVNLSDANLLRANLQDVDLSDATLVRTNLSYVHMQKAILRRANLQDANLHRADLREANLSRADLQRASLLGVYLRAVDLRWASLQDADLRDADLIVADLSNADLRGADLRGATLDKADLRGATISKAALDSALSYDDAIIDETTRFLP